MLIAAGANAMLSQGANRMSLADKRKMIDGIGSAHCPSLQYSTQETNAAGMRALHRLTLTRL
jgi:hypothetical protein